MSDSVRFQRYVDWLDQDGASTAAFSGPEQCLRQFVAELEQDDVLVQLNALELLPRFCALDASFEYLLQHRVLDKLIERLQGLALADDGNSLLNVGIVRLFPRVAQASVARFLQLDTGAIWQSYVDILAHGSGTGPYCESAVAALGSFGSDPLLLPRMLDNPAILTQWFATLHGAYGDLKTASLWSLAMLLSNPDPLLLLQQSLWPRVSASGSQSPLEYLVSEALSVLEERRLACYAIFAALVRHAWAVADMAKTAESAGFIPWLLNRDLETSHQGCVKKYEILQALAQPQNSKQFPELVQRQIRSFIQQGPFYNKSSVHVAYERV